MIIYSYICTSKKWFFHYMIIEYADDELKILITTGNSTDKRYKKLKSNATFKKDLAKVMLYLRSVSTAKELANFGALHYEQLKHDLSGKSSVRIGYESKYRLIFEELDLGVRVCLIEINEHYGDT